MINIKILKRTAVIIIGLLAVLSVEQAFFVKEAFAYCRDDCSQCGQRGCCSAGDWWCCYEGKGADGLCGGCCGRCDDDEDLVCGGGVCRCVSDGDNGPGPTECDENCECVPDGGGIPCSIDDDCYPCGICIPCGCTPQ